ncbi:MAG: threonine synthase [Planctomycetota bacterium]|nr:threonine synthase [Planctomycetota bacterium]
MRVAALRCFFCSAEYPPGLLYFCERCGGTLEARGKWDAAALKDAVAGANRCGDRRGAWRYREMLPVSDRADPVTMGEGGTPLLRAGRLAETLGHDRVYLKNETVNPTLSFKDRPMSVAATKAVGSGLAGIVAASTGNTGVSAAAYAAKAGLPCSIYVPAGTPSEKTRLIEIYGAKIERVAGNFSDAWRRALEDARREGLFNVTSTYLNPYACEGDKTVAYEIFADLGEVPDWVAIPVGAGPLLWYCLKGFRELVEAGIADRLPRMAAVQAEGCAPIAKAWEAGADEVEPWGEPATAAGGIADPLAGYPRDGTRTLRAVRESGGVALRIPERDIPEYVALLARTEAVCAEPASAIAVAAARKLRESGRLRPGETFVAVITGHGVKDLDAAVSHPHLPHGPSAPAGR